MLPHDEAGSGPAVVLIHAGIADRTMWAEHLAPLAEAGFRVVAVDLPGFGEAPVAEGEPAAWADVLETMDALGIERAALVGCSFGADVALRAAVVAPDRVSALVLLGAQAPDLEPSPELEAAWEAEEAPLERGDVEAAVAAVVDAWTLPGAPDALRERVAAMQRRAYELQGGAGAEELPDPLEDDPGLLARVDVPALVAAGERDKPDFVEGAAELARTLPRARHAVFAGAGHLAPLETPEAFRALLLGFLRDTAHGLRPAAPADVEALGRGVVEGVADYPSFAPPAWTPPSAEDEAEHLRALLADERVSCVVAEAGGRLVGQVTVLPAALAPHPVDDPALGHLRNLFVDRDHWGTGLAGALHAAALDAARERGYAELRLFVAAGQTRARRFYEREGWVAVGDEFHDPAPGLPLVEYRRTLRDGVAGRGPAA